MNLRVVETSDWSAIEQAALVAGTCIRPDGINNPRAKETFEMGGVRYFIQEARNSAYQWDVVGYVRLHKVSDSTSNSLWIVDFAPPVYLPIYPDGGPATSHPLAGAQAGCG
jgi:hypothetical protein